jgi:phage shock protein B
MDTILQTLLGWGPIVLIVWLFLHYRWKTARARSGLSDEDLTRLEHLHNTAQHLEQRTQVLESILDDNVPDWRRYS